jgi:hypothetical protein
MLQSHSSILIRANTITPITSVFHTKSQKRVPMSTSLKVMYHGSWLMLNYAVMTP